MLVINFAATVKILRAKVFEFSILWQPLLLETTPLLLPIISDYILTENCVHDIIIIIRNYNYKDDIVYFM